MNYIVVKQIKSKGIAILLILLFGPLGLFYSSVTGGIIMSLIPIFLIILMITGIYEYSTFLLEISFFLFLISYWLICLIWAVVSVKSYNKKIIKEANQTNFDNETFLLSKFENNNEKQSNIPKIPKDKITNSNNKPSLQDWRIEFPNKTLNDYYSIYGTSSNTAFQGKSNNNIHINSVKSKNSKLWFWIVIVILFFFTIAFLMYDKEFKNFNSKNIIYKFSSEIKEKDLIKNQIEKVYLGLRNGAYTENGFARNSSESIPFYNSDFSTLMFMYAPLGILGGPISLEPQNINIINLNSNIADVSYDLIIYSENGNSKVASIKMTLKKISGSWKLDGKKFYPY